MYQPLFKKESKYNNIEENVTILNESIMPEQDNSIIFLAAHSGTGNIAFFRHLDQLKQGDKIDLKYKDIIYHYQIDTIWEEKKKGYIHVNKTNKKQLILTTCSPKDDSKQLIINSSLIQEENTSVH